MRIQFVFLGGPLDGLRIDGTDEGASNNSFDFGWICYQLTKGGRLGAQFNTFNPLAFADLPIPRPPLRLHTYEVAAQSTGDPFDLRILALHVRQSDRALPSDAASFIEWMSRPE